MLGLKTRAMDLMQDGLIQPGPQRPLKLWGNGERSAGNSSFRALLHHQGAHTGLRESPSRMKVAGRGPNDQDVPHGFWQSLISTSSPGNVCHEMSRLGWKKVFR
jgi:hypothetical protein